MERTNVVVNIASKRSAKELLIVWDSVRAGILRGDLRGFTTTLCDSEGRETNYAAGVYTDPQRALQSAVRLAADQSLKMKDEPLRRRGI